MTYLLYFNLVIVNSSTYLPNGIMEKITISLEFEKNHKQPKMHKTW